MPWVERIARAKAWEVIEQQQVDLRGWYVVMDRVRKGDGRLIRNLWVPD